MKKLIFSALALGLVFVACEKKEVVILENENQTTEQTEVNSRYCYSCTVVLEEEEDYWDFYDWIWRFFGTPPAPTVTMEYASANYVELIPFLGEGRVTNLMDGSWNAYSEGELAVGSTYTLNFTEDGAVVDILYVETAF